MTTRTNADPRPALRRQQRRVQTLQTAVYSRADPALSPDLLRQLGEAQELLRKMDQEATAPATGTVVAVAEPVAFGRFLGPETTGLRVTSTVNMQPLPTGIYHLLDPEKDPLVSIVVENVSDKRETRRLCVRVFLEGLSAEAVRTVELKRKEKVELKLLPMLLPERARMLTEVQRATLHVLVTDRKSTRLNSSHSS